MTTINSICAQGTNAERLAYTPTPPTPVSGPPHISVFWTETDTGNVYFWNTLTSAWAAVGGGGGGTPANPTATAGPTAVNGSATTYMRSDAAPAVQQGSASQKGIVQVDGTTITATSGVISAVGAGGAPPVWAVVGNNGLTAADTTLFATMGQTFTVTSNTKVDKLMASWNNATIGNIYNMFIAEISNVGVVVSTVATATAFTTTATGDQSHEFALSSAVTLVPNKFYLCALVLKNQTTTTSCKMIVSQSNGSSWSCLPLDFALMNNSWGSTLKRYWFAQNSDAPAAGVTATSSATSQTYCAAMRLST